jgi:hypothetical protein
LFLGCWGTTVSQTFNNSYFGNALAVGAGNSHILINDSLFTISYDQNNPKAVLIRSYSRTGSILDSNFLSWNEQRISFIACRPFSLTYNYSNRKFYAAIDVFIAGGGVELKLIAFNASGDSTKTKSWILPNFPLTSTFDIISEDGTITVVGHYGNLSSKLNLFIAQFDTAFNLLWYNTIADFRGGPPNLFNGYYPYRFQKTDDAYYVVGRCFYPNVMVEGFVVKTDLQGNKIWDKRFRFDNQKNSIFTDILFLEDSLIVSGGFHATKVGNFDLAQIGLVTLDTAGNVLNEVRFPEQRPIYIVTSLIQTKDSNFVLSSYHHHTNIYAVYGVLTKLSKDLTTLWRRTYYHGHVTNDENFIHRVAEWSDGGLIASGTHYREFSPQNEFVHLWLLSTDSNGCLDANNCGHNINLVEFEKLNTEQLRVYPNPTRGSIVLELPDNFSEAAQVRLINPSGQLALETTVFFELGKAPAQLGNLPTGIYTLVLHTKQEVFHLKISVL